MQRDNMDWDAVVKDIVDESMKGWATASSQWADIVLQDFIEEHSRDIRTFYMIKYLQMKVGVIWQRVIGKVPGVLNLGTGHASGLDIMTDGSGGFAGECEFAMELKNAFNSDNSSSKKQNMGKLVHWVKDNPRYAAIYGIVNCSGSVRGDWTGEDRTVEHDGVMVRHLSGKKLLKFLFGQKEYDTVLQALRRHIALYCQRI